MASTLLTPTQVTRESLRILHQKLNFVGSINRQYDDSFAQSGAKIGDSIKIRLPNQYLVYDGPDVSSNFQETTESSVTLTVDKYKSVPLVFTDKELTLSIDKFSERYLEPAMSVLAATIEADAFSMYKDVYQQVGSAGTVPNSLRVLNQARAKLTDSLAPTSDRTVILNTDAQVEIVDAVKGLFQDSSAIASQYKDGLMGRTAGFGNIYENTLIPVHTNGTATGSHTVTTTATEAASTLAVTGTGAQTMKKGTIFTVANVYSVHPETKVSTGKLQQFVVTADATASGGAYTLSVSPAMIASTTNPAQNINSLPQGSATVTLVGSASTSYAQNLAFHKDAFVFGTADLFLPKGAHFAGRDSMDGISMRIWQDADVKTGKLYTRADVLYGYKTARAQLATRITA